MSKVVRRAVRGLVVGFLVSLGAALPAIAQKTGYVGSETCIACHAEAGEAWRGSHHDLAWTSIEDGNIEADFDGTRFALGEMVAEFRLDESGAPHVRVTELDGETRDYPIHSVIGEEPLQQYVIETAPGRMQSFDVVWDTEKGEWFHLYPDQELLPDDALHWSGPYKNWNDRCATCHATGFEANYNSATRSYDSTMSEIGVGCEACHGPGARHLEWAEAWDATAVEQPPLNYGFAVDFSDTEVLIQQCAGCHSRRETFFDGNPVPGTPYHDAYSLSLLRPGLYEADGQILDEDYVYGSFLQSKMYSMGVGCVDCHMPHGGDLIAEGNAVCAQCHSLAGNPEFPSLPLVDFDSPEHTHHPEGSAGAECKNCHMVERVYMGNDWRADHSFRVPRPDLNGETGAPDACTTCHSDQQPGWAAARLEEWFPESTHRGPHFGQILAHGRRNPQASMGELVGLARDEGEAGIVRATALWLLEQPRDPSAAEAVSGLLDDPDPLVRAAAVKAMRAIEPQQRTQRVIPLLGDPARAVRIAAAQAMFDSQIAYLPDHYREMMTGAFTDWQQMMEARLGFPEAQLQLGGSALTMRNFQGAVDAFAEATVLDPALVNAWSMRVRLAEALGDPARALEILDQGLAANPDAIPLIDLQRRMSGQAPGLLPPPRE
ncbi:HEAT repeat domain-containing protein [Pseudooceanicola algae]|uniref:HEAT repeat domain-containing protein n=1 Tax=Pseudooceanicola algae TaxID=1537215 RepID=UPI0018AD1DDC|nr:HEAT repeat domain-containing protein [Pseudooceanicola algae]